MADWRMNAVLIVMVAACGAESSPPLPLVPIEGADRTIEVSLKEFAFDLSTGEFHPGETIGFRVLNQGVVSHSFRVTRVEALEEYLSTTRSTPEQEEEAIERLDAQSTFMKVGPGDTRNLVVRFDTADPYDVIVCLVPGHFEAGMREDLSITP